MARIQEHSPYVDSWSMFDLESVKTDYSKQLLFVLMFLHTMNNCMPLYQVYGYSVQ